MLNLLKWLKPKSKAVTITHSCGCVVYKPDGADSWGGTVLKSCWDKVNYVRAEENYGLVD